MLDGQVEAVFNHLRVVRAELKRSTVFFRPLIEPYSE